MASRPWRLLGRIHSRPRGSSNGRSSGASVSSPCERKPSQGRRESRVSWQRLLLTSRLAYAALALPMFRWCVTTSMPHARWSTDRGAIATHSRRSLHRSNRPQPLQGRCSRTAAKRRRVPERSMQVSLPRTIPAIGPAMFEEAPAPRLGSQARLKSATKAHRTAAAPAHRPGSWHRSSSRAGTPPSTAGDGFPRRRCGAETAARRSGPAPCRGPRT